MVKGIDRYASENVIGEATTDPKCGIKQRYFIFRNSFESQKAGCYDLDGNIFISDQAPERFRDIIVLHEVIEYQFLSRCAPKEVIKSVLSGGFGLMVDNTIFAAHKEALTEEMEAAARLGIFDEYWSWRWNHIMDVQEP